MAFSTSRCSWVVESCSKITGLVASQYTLTPKAADKQKKNAVRLSRAVEILAGTLCRVLSLSMWFEESMYVAETIIRLARYHGVAVLLVHHPIEEVAFF